MGYTKKAVEGFGLQTIFKGSSSVLSLIKIFFLARLLAPYDFGLFGLTAIALGLTESLTQTGINITILQSKKSVKEFLNTAWVIAIIRGVVIGAIMLLLAKVLSSLYNEPNLVSLISLAALVPVIKGFINPNIVSWQKNLQYKTETKYHISLKLIETLLAVSIAYVTQSALALILALIGTAIFEVLISFLVFKDRPKWQYSSTIGRLIFNNAKGLSISAALHYANDNLDDVVLGKTLGTSGLGLYHNAYNLAHKPNYELSKSAFHSILPILTKFTKDISRFNRGFFRSIVVMMLIATVTTAPLFIFPELLVTVILGEQWLSIVPVLPWLALAGWVHSLAGVAYGGLVAIKRYSLINFHLFFTLFTMIILVWYLSMNFGLIGAGWGVLLSRVISLPILLYGLARVRRR
jgi:O-antigen/teichoic acid export membrane protein